MVRLYYKGLKKLRDGQNVALISVLENGNREIEYYQFIKSGTTKWKGRTLYSFKSLETGYIRNEWNIIVFYKKYQKKWPIVYEQYNGKDIYVICRYFAKLSEKDEAKMLANLLSN